MTPAAIHQQFHRFQQSREKYYAPKFEKILNAQVADFAKWYYGGSLEDSLIRMSSVPLYTLIKNVRIDGAIVYGSKVRAYLPKFRVQKKSMVGLHLKLANVFKTRPVMGHNQEMINLINAYFDKEILATAEGITDTTREQIRQVFKEANEQGKGITWMVSRMEEINSKRAKLIARTETVTAANSGGFISALSVGLMMQKQWLATMDDRTRVDHFVISGTKIGMLDYFNVGTDTMLHPGDRTQENGLATSAAETCNCRCVCMYIPVRVDDKLVSFDYSRFRDLVL